MTAPTMQQMAQAYIDNVHGELERAKNTLMEHEKTISALEEHLRECIRSQQDEEGANTPSFSQENKTVIGNPDGSTTKTIKLPNPFEQIQAQTSNSEG